MVMTNDALDELADLLLQLMKACGQQDKQEARTTILELIESGPSESVGWRGTKMEDEETFDLFFDEVWQRYRALN